MRRLLREQLLGAIDAFDASLGRLEHVVLAQDRKVQDTRAVADAGGLHKAPLQLRRDNDFAARRRVVHTAIARPAHPSIVVLVYLQVLRGIERLIRVTQPERFLGARGRTVLSA